MNVVRRTSLVCGLLILGVGLGGCDVASEFINSRSLRPSLDGTATSSDDRAALNRTKPIGKADATTLILSFFGFEAYESGSFKPTAPGVAAIQDKRVSGPFEATLPKAVALPQRPAARPVGGLTIPKKVSGTFVAEFDGSTDSNTDKSSLSGLQVLEFKQKSLGLMCVRMSIDFSQRGTKGRGKFGSIGGTKESATTRVSGTVGSTVAVQSPTTSEDSGKITATAKFNKAAKGLTPACKTLAEKLP